jgi:hypothetical protein
VLGLLEEELIHFLCDIFMINFIFWILNELDKFLLATVRARKVIQSQLRKGLHSFCIFDMTRICGVFGIPNVQLLTDGLGGFPVLPLTSRTT